MSRPDSSKTRVIGLLTEIRDKITIVNGHAAETAANTRSTARDARRAVANLSAIKRDVSKMRAGDSGGGSDLRGDTLTPAERRQVNEVKRRFRAKRQENPHYPLLAVSRSVLRDALAVGERSGYKKELALNARASKEIKREDAGLPPF